jgi:hypothetical protein
MVDNHLINNPIFSLIEIKDTIPEEIWIKIREIRKIILSHVSNDRTSNYVFTNVLYEEYLPDELIYNQIKNAAYIRDSIFVPVILTVSEEERKIRII